MQRALNVMHYTEAGMNNMAAFLHAAADEVHLP